MKNYKELFEIVENIDRQNAQVCSSGQNFNVFNILGLWSEEVRLHSSFLAELLNPKGTHGQGDTYLRLFLQQVFPPEVAKDFAIDDEVQVFKEYYIGHVTKTTGGRIDILIKLGDKAIVIENKIYAGDQENQLVRYANYLKEEENYKKYSVIYLTLHGIEPSVESAGDVPYTCCSYKETICAWLDECVKKTQAKTNVTEVINQYKNLIEQIINPNTNKIMETLVSHIIEKDDVLKKALEIGQAYAEIQKQALNEKLCPKLSSVCNSLKSESGFEISYTGEPYIYRNQVDILMQYEIKVKDQESVIVRFIFNAYGLKGLYWGILRDSSYKLNDELIISQGKKDANWPYGWAYVEEKFKNWDDPDTFVNRINGDEFINYIKSKLQEVIKMIEETNKLNKF